MCKKPSKITNVIPTADHLQVLDEDTVVADAPIDAASEEEENALEDDMVDAAKAQQLRVEGNEHFKAI